MVFSRFRASDADALLDLDAQIDYQDASGKFPKLQGGFRHGWVHGMIIPMGFQESDSYAVHLS